MCLNLSTSTMDRVPTISIDGDYAMTRDTGCFTTASSHVRVLLNYIFIHAVSLSVYPVVRRIDLVL